MFARILPLILLISLVMSLGPTPHARASGTSGSFSVVAPAPYFSVFKVWFGSGDSGTGQGMAAVQYRIWTVDGSPLDQFEAASFLTYGPYPNDGAGAGVMGDQAYNQQQYLVLTGTPAGNVSYTTPEVKDRGFSSIGGGVNFVNWTGDYELLIMAGAKAAGTVMVSLSVTFSGEALVLASTEGTAYYATMRDDFTHTADAGYTNRDLSSKARVVGSLQHTFHGRAYYVYETGQCLCRIQSNDTDHTLGFVPMSGGYAYLSLAPGPRSWDYIVTSDSQVDPFTPMSAPQNHLPAYDPDILGADIPDY